MAFIPRRVRIGGRVVMTFALRSTSTRPQHLLVDVAVHFVKARGVAAPKVFKLARVALGPRERVDLRTRSRSPSTRPACRGRASAVDVIVNGRAMRRDRFSVFRRETYF